MGAEDSAEHSVRSPATTALIVVCVGMFVWTFSLAVVELGWSGVGFRSLWTLDSPDAFRATGGLVCARVWIENEWWRVATAGFVHGSWLHLGLNSWALWVVGTWTERAWGPTRFLVTFMLSSIGGCLASMAWAEAPIIVGASAGIFGLAGGLVVARRFGDEELRERLAPVAGGRLAVWLAIWLVVGWSLPMLANAGHAGGLVVGLALGLGLSRMRARVAGFGAAAIALGGLGWFGDSPVRRPNMLIIKGFYYFEADRSSEAIPLLAEALELEPSDHVLQNAVAYELALKGRELVWAEQLVLDALGEEPDNPNYLDTLGWVLCRQGRVEEGLVQLEAAAAADTTENSEIAAHLVECSAASVR